MEDEMNIVSEESKELNTRVQDRELEIKELRTKLAEKENELMSKVGIYTPIIK